MLTLVFLGNSLPPFASYIHSLDPLPTPATLHCAVRPFPYSNRLPRLLIHNPSLAPNRNPRCALRNWKWLVV